VASIRQTFALEVGLLMVALALLATLSQSARAALSEPAPHATPGT
jgi:hypothetical protein